MPYTPMYEAAYGLVATISRVKDRPLAPTALQMGRIVSNLSILRTGTSVRLDRARLRSIALGEPQPDIASILSYIELDKVLTEVFNEQVVHTSDG
jgi:hypothetical protein